MCYAYCNVKSTDQGEMSTQEILHLLEMLYEWGVVRVNYVGGEVGMRMDFPQIVEHGQRLGLVQGIITNGVILGHAKRFEQMFTQFYRVQISCNGYRQTWEQEVNLPIWDKYEHAVRNIVSHTPKHVDLSLSFIVTPDNLSSIPDAAAFAGKVGIRKIRYGILQAMGSGAQARAAMANYFRDIVGPAHNTIVSLAAANPDMIIETQTSRYECGKDIRPVEFVVSPEGRDTLYIDAQIGRAHV